MRSQVVRLVLLERLGVSEVVANLWQSMTGASMEEGIRSGRVSGQCDLRTMRCQKDLLTAEQCSMWLRRGYEKSGRGGETAGVLTSSKEGLVVES